MFHTRQDGCWLFTKAFFAASGPFSYVYSCFLHLACIVADLSNHTAEYHDLSSAARRRTPSRFEKLTSLRSPAPSPSPTPLEPALSSPAAVPAGELPPAFPLPPPPFLSFPLPTSAASAAGALAELLAELEVSLRVGHVCSVSGRHVWILYALFENGIERYWVAKHECDIITQAGCAWVLAGSTHVVNDKDPNPTVAL